MSKDKWGEIVSKPSTNAFGANVSQRRAPDGTLIKGYGSTMERADESRQAKEKAWKERNKEE